MRTVCIDTFIAGAGWQLEKEMEIDLEGKLVTFMEGGKDIGWIDFNGGEMHVEYDRDSNTIGCVHGRDYEGNPIEVHFEDIYD